jgi:predicted protein tyrosine phosphatase
MDVEEIEPLWGMTEEQAAEIADFALKVKRKVKRFIVHCEYGQSRSAGVAAALSQYFEGHDNCIFLNRRYHPNRMCFRLVLEALKKQGGMFRFLRR